MFDFSDGWHENGHPECLVKLIASTDTSIWGQREPLVIATCIYIPEDNGWHALAMSSSDYGRGESWYRCEGVFDTGEEAAEVAETLAGKVASETVDGFYYIGTVHGIPREYWGTELQSFDVEA